MFVYGNMNEKHEASHKPIVHAVISSLHVPVPFIIVTIIPTLHGSMEDYEVSYKRETKEERGRRKEGMEKDEICKESEKARHTNQHHTHDTFPHSPLFPSMPLLISFILHPPSLSCAEDEHVRLRRVKEATHAQVMV